MVDFLISVRSLFIIIPVCCHFTDEYLQLVHEYQRLVDEDKGLIHEYQRLVNGVISLVKY